MARSFTDNGSTTTSYVGKSTAVATGFPITISCFVNPTAFSSFPVVVQIDDGTNNNFVGIGLDSTGHVVAQSCASGTIVKATSAAALTANTWHVATAVFTSTTLRAAFIDGGSKNFTTTSNAPAAFSRSTIGSDRVNGDGMSGSIAWVGIWKIALSDTDVATLTADHPSLVHPESLVACVDLVGFSPEPDRFSATGWTTGGTGASAVSASPRIVFRQSSWKYVPRKISFGGTAHPAISASGSPTVSRLFAGTVTTATSDSTTYGGITGAVTVSRNPSATAHPLVSASGFVTVITPFGKTLRVAASGAITTPVTPVQFAGSALVKVSASGALIVSRPFLGTANPLVHASGSITVISARLMNGTAVLKLTATGTLSIAAGAIILSVTGYYVFLDIEGQYLSDYLIAGVNYAGKLQEIISGPYPDPGTAFQALWTFLNLPFPFANPLPIPPPGPWTNR